MKQLLCLLLLSIPYTSFADEPEITAKDVVIPVHLNASTNSYIPLTATFSLMKTTFTKVIVDQSYTIPECMDITIDPNAGDWKGFWDATGTDRAQRLSFALKGLKITDAEKILQEGLFLYRPRFWSEFTKEIRNAEIVLSQLGNSVQFTDEVTVINGEANARALGFWSDANCRMNTVTRPVTTLVKVLVPAGTLSRHYMINVLGTLFQSFESEDLTFSLGFTNNEVRVMSSNASPLHTYQVQPVLNPDNSVTVMLLAKRQLISLPGDTYNGTLTRVSTGFEADLVVDPKVLPSSEDPNSKLMVEFTVCHSVFLGCKTIETAKMEMTGTSLSPTLTGSYQTGEHYRLVYRFTRTNSRFYESGGSTGQTNRIQF